MAKSDEKTVDDVGDFGSHSDSCRFGGAFSSDYMPLSLCNSAFSSFSELSVLEPVEILGVDEVSHEGILIRLLIKTQPIEHWGIGREYRLRVKQAFDEAGISLGIPHHKISVTDSSTNNEQLLSDFLLAKDD